MEQFVVSARKYRPGRFVDVVGQEHITHTLLNALRLGRPAHAYLFCGPRGVGKTTCARILAKAVNCQNPAADGEPCNACDSCRNFNEGRSLTIFELDAASNNSVDDVRQLIEQLRYIPQGGKRSVYIIDEVHMLSTAAFNAFLKTLEEPPAHALFILATTEKHKIPATILSRCQKFDFRRIPPEPITEHLADIAKQEGIEYEEEALFLVAQKADGGLRDALSLFDTLVNFGQGRLTHAVALDQLNVLDYDVYFRLTDLMLTGDHAEALLLLNNVVERGFDVYSFLSGLVEHLRNLLVGRQAKTFALLEVSQNVRRRYQEQAKALPPSLLLHAFHLASEAEQKFRNSRQPRLLVELLLVKIVHLQSAFEAAAAPPAAEKKKP